MPKYLLEVSYTAEGARGVLKEGGSSRVKVVEALTKELGGKLEAFYFAFGKNDVYVIVDAPDNVSVAAVSNMPVGESRSTKCPASPRSTTIQPLIHTRTRMPCRPPACSTDGTHRIGPSSIDVVIAIMVIIRRKNGFVSV